MAQAAVTGQFDALEKALKVSTYCLIKLCTHTSFKPKMFIVMQSLKLQMDVAYL